MSTLLRWLVVLVILAVMVPAVAKTKPCTRADAAAAALAEGGCWYPGPSKNEADARRRMAALAPHIRWSTTLRVDLVGKGIPDYVMLGKGQSEVVVGVVLGTACDEKFIFRFKNDSGSQNGLCRDSAAVRLSATGLASRDDSDAPLAARGEPDTRRRGFRLESGDCDSFHFYYDGLAVRWWRR